MIEVGTAYQGDTKQGKCRKVFSLGIQQTARVGFELKPSQWYDFEQRPKQIRARKAYRIKWDLLANKKVKYTFASKVAYLFIRELPDLLKMLRLSGIYLNQQLFHLQLLVWLQKWEKSSE